MLTLADADTAAVFMADARTAISAKGCPRVPGVEVTSPGASTADGVSWLWTEAPPNADEYGHAYLVRVDDRVALLRVNQFGGDTVRGTVGDKTVLHNLAEP